MPGSNRVIGPARPDFYLKTNGAARTKRECNATGPGGRWGHGPHRVRYSAACDHEELKFALNGRVEDAQVQLLMHTHACEDLGAGDRITDVTCRVKLAVLPPLPTLSSTPAETVIFCLSRVCR